jgi:hypothetical protein
MICREVDGTGGHHVKLNKPNSERQISYISLHMWNLYLKKDMDIKGG